MDAVTLACRVTRSQVHHIWRENVAREIVSGRKKQRIEERLGEVEAEGDEMYKRAPAEFGGWSATVRERLDRAPGRWWVARRISDVYGLMPLRGVRDRPGTVTQL